METPSALLALQLWKPAMWDLMLSLLLAQINYWTNGRVVADLRRHDAQVIVISDIDSTEYGDKQI